MEKNTVWAIVLSTVVIVAAFIVQPLVFPNAFGAKNKTAVEKNTENTVDKTAQTTTKEQQSDEFATKTEKSSAAAVIAASDEEIEEKTIVISTKKAMIRLTNRGGDITGYELADHIDTDTNKGVEMADNISEINRACSVSFGDSDKDIINDLYNVEQTTTEDGKQIVTFTKKYQNFVFGKRYTFAPEEYLFKLEILVHSDGTDSGMNFNNVAYTLRTAPQIGPHFDSKVNRYEVRQFLAHNENKTKRINLGSKQFKEYDKAYSWTGITGKYFVELVFPAESSKMGTVFYSSKIETNNYANAQALLERKSFTDSDMNDTYYVYFGPRSEKDLKIYNTAATNTFGIDNSKLDNSLPSDWLGWLETILKWIMEIVYKLIPNWGVSIIIMTILLKAATFPLIKKQSITTAKMQDLQPQIQAVQAKYKENPQKLQEQMSKIYKESGYNPASGCLPMLLQFLVLFAMYNLFNNYFEFRGASFIPGWIPDLSAGDSVYTLKFMIPLFGNHIRILPIIYLASQLFYGKITQNGGTASAAGTSAAQMKFLMYGMPVIFFFMFYNAPSGLLLYWTVSNILQMVSQIVINNIMKQKAAGTPAVKNFKK